MSEYPWYGVVNSEEPLLQGDFVDACPVIVPKNAITLVACLPTLQNMMLLL